jgi:hypothetical protein
MLDSHIRGYQLTNKETLQGIVLSPFVSRHADLAKNKSTPRTQRFGHYFLAIVESIPLVGMLASLIERIVAIAYKFLKGKAATLKPLKPTPKAAPEILKVQNAFNEVPNDITGHLSKFLPISDGANFAIALGKTKQNYVWNGLAQQISGRAVPSGKCPQDIIKKYLAYDLMNFFDWFKKFSFLKPIKEKYTDVFQQASALRKLLSTDPKVQQEILEQDSIYIENSLRKSRDDRTLIPKLSAIPPEIKYFKNVTVISFSCNELTSLPRELFELSKLEKLFLNQNRLTTIPPMIAKLTNLRRLNLEENRITYLPPEIDSLENCEITMGGNPLKTKFPDMTERLRLELERAAKMPLYDMNGNRLTQVGHMDGSAETRKGSPGCHVQ